MKFYKYFIFLTTALFCLPALSANSPVVKNMVYGGVEGRQKVRYQPDFESNFYVSLTGSLNLLNFKNDYTLGLNVGNETGSDSFSGEQTFGFGGAIGYQFAPRWRAEVSYDTGGKFEDSDDLIDFSLKSQYVMANAFYSFYEETTTNLYVGLGAGAAIQSARMSGPVFAIDASDTQDKTTFAIAGMLGIEEAITKNFFMGAQWRIMYNGGMTHTRTVDYVNTEGGHITGTQETKIGGVLTNSLRLGVRYKF